MWHPFPSSLLTAIKWQKRTVHSVQCLRGGGKAGAPLFSHRSFPGSLPCSRKHPRDPQETRVLQPRASAFDLSVLTSEQPCCHASQYSLLEIRKRRRSFIKYFFSWIFVHPEKGPCGVSASRLLWSSLVSRAGSWVTGSWITVTGECCKVSNRPSRERGDPPDSGMKAQPNDTTLFLQLK